MIKRAWFVFCIAWTTLLTYAVVAAKNLDQPTASVVLFFALLPWLVGPLVRWIFYGSQ